METIDKERTVVVDATNSQWLIVVRKSGVWEVLSESPAPKDRPVPWKTFDDPNAATKYAVEHFTRNEEVVVISTGPMLYRTMQDFSPEKSKLH